MIDITRVLAVVLFSCCCLMGCAVHDKHFYINHPKVLERDLANCQPHPSQGLNCEQLASIAREMNQLAYEFRHDQQRYGHEILTLQYEKTTQGPKIRHEIDNELDMRLAVVKWLASPGR
jgi:hypothetical protein